MVDRLMPPILVHQTLHGYNDGHRLISSSMALDGADARIMLVMSDLSGPGVKPSPDGYLTGYPLEKSGRYVLARTWSAPEMPRPGCVWTHSLIIENADLAKLTSAQGLLEAFSRPEDPITRPLYELSIPVPLEPRLDVSLRTERARALLHALYSFADRTIVSEADTNSPFEDERVVTAIWMQQWPRLRRTFGFCTLSGMDRSGKGVTLDLQLAREHERQLLSKFPNAVFADGSDFTDELQPLLVDLVHPAKSTLREFLRRTGGDVDGGRRAMLPLCKLHKSLLASHPPDLSSAVYALATLDGDGRRQARSVRMLVAREALKAADHIEDTVLEFLLDTLEAIDPVEHANLLGQLGCVLWRRSPRRFHSALLAGGFLGDAASRALEEMQPGQIVTGLEANGDIAADIADRRPDLLVHTDFWEVPDVPDALATRISERDIGAAALALLAAGRVGPAETIISRVNPVDLIGALESDEANPIAAGEWLAALCRNRNQTAAVLATGLVRRISTVVTIARLSHPDEVPNAYGDDPWLISLLAASGPLNHSDQDFLAAFLLARALGRESRSQAELLQYSFTRVYKAFQERRFSSEVERLATWRLNGGGWFVWDNCSRLRETVTGRFVDHELDPGIFGRLTDDGSLAISLIDEAARTGRGRRYLERVRKALKDAGEKDFKATADYIAKKLE
ncbi:hypothetical protein GOL96_32125 [Sinorhizobium medicae]|nr:hypothetical protein [Sinorhizobium medicae]MDX1238288.1 hypothetical protein [Sinorhizobium medicae]